MSTNQFLNLNRLNGFQNIDEKRLVELQKKSKLVRYTIGQPLSTKKDISDTIHIIIEGSARLVGNESGKSFTIAKLSSGAMVGLSSLLRSSPCEDVNAITDLITLAIPDHEILKLYQENSNFKTWCNQTIHPAEVFDIGLRQLDISPMSEMTAFDLYKEMCQNIELKVMADNTTLESKDNITWIAASGNIKNTKIGEAIVSRSIINITGNFPARIIGISTDANKMTNSKPTKVETNKIALTDELKDRAINSTRLPGTTSIDLGQSENSKSFKLIKAEGKTKELQACLKMLAAEMNLPYRRDTVEKIIEASTKRGQKPSMEMCGYLASVLGLQAYSAKVPPEFGTRLQTPSLIVWQNSFALVRSSNSEELIVASPRDDIINVKANKLEEAFPDGIEILLVERTNTTPGISFGFSWFWPAIQKHKSVLVQVLLASFVVQLFGLANPLLIQVIIDKVITQRSLDTLQILGFALIVVTILGGFIGGLRTFLFAETTNRIDTRLGAEVIDHLLRLPLGYFDRRPVGELGTRIAELEKVRNFLTGQALTTILDAAFSVIYIVVMFLYSSLLTFIALAVVPLQIAMTLIGAPLIRRQIRDGAEKNAQTQSHLVEVLTGIQTVKAQNVETVSRWKWQKLYNAYIARTFEKTISTTVLGQTSTVLQQLSQLLVLWIGAALVLQGNLTLGQLIAFRIISGYVTQPLLRLSSIWQSIQELRVSFERLADIIDTPEESSDLDKAKIPLPSIKGTVKFEDVSFRFKQGAANVLKNINLEIEPGTFVGIAGQSGSGKSTLMKLLPRLYKPNEGRIFVDNYDIEKVELYSLRRQIGIVPQDPLLFAGSVSENIALTDPESSSDDIVKASKIAEAHDFVMSLPLGYSSNVGERGASISGGQRQRLAIARTLLSQPKLLVMDEATSALDYDTERKVCNNLREHCKDITVFFITHRLSTIRNADLIIMMHQGIVAEVGSHEKLMELKGRYYALYIQQEATR